MNTQIKKCHIDAWYKVSHNKIKNLLNLKMMTPEDYKSERTKLAWEYWERLERIDSGEK